MKKTIKRYVKRGIIKVKRFFGMLFVLGFRAYVKLRTPKFPVINCGSGPENGWEERPKDESLMKEFASTVGATLKTADNDATFPPVYKNLGVITAKQICEDSRERIDEIIENSEWDDDIVKGALIRHEATGQTYFYTPDAYCLFPVADLEYANGVYSNIRVNIFYEDDWQQAPVDFDGTRVGGITDYDLKKWPHYKRTPLKFLGQYRLPDGTYIHMFAHVKSILAAEMERGANCAIVEGGPIPSWITLRPLPKRKRENSAECPEFAFAPVAKKSDMAPTPDWIQWESIPDNPHFRFLMQYGYITIPQEKGEYQSDKVMIDDCLEWYLHHNPITKEARLHAQSS